MSASRSNRPLTAYKQSNQLAYFRTPDFAKEHWAWQ